MNTFGIGDVDGQQVEHATRGLQRGVDDVLRQRLVDSGLDEAGEQGDGGDDCRADREALGDGLGRVADGVEADHDAGRLAVELAAHLGDAGGVVADRTERVFGDDDAGGGQHAHAAECDEVERELQVAAAEGQRCTDRDRDRQHCVDRALHAAGGTGEDHRCRAGLGAGSDLLDGAVMRGRVELGQAADALRQHEADRNGAEALPTGVAEVVADVDQGDEQRADQRQRAGNGEALVDGLEGVGLALLRLDEEDADDRGDHADRTSGQREDEAECRVGADRVERGDTEDDRGDEGDLVALEQVGCHAGAVADVVADVVGDGGRVARVVLGNAGFDLADEVGADVGCLGEDAAADAQEQGQQRAAETEPDEDDRRRVLEDRDDRGCTQAGRDRR